MAKITKLPKFIDNILFPDITAKHWKLFNKYNASKSRIRKLFLLARIKKIQRSFNCSIPVSRKIDRFTLLTVCAAYSYPPRQRYRRIA